MKKRIGLIVVLLGVLLYVLSFIFGWTRSNAVLITALILVIGGSILHIQLIKRS